MKTKQKLIVTLALAFTAIAEAGDSGSYLRKSFLVCVNKDAEVELMAELTQDLDQPANAIYETAGTAVYNFKGKQYSGAKYQKQHMALRYGSQGSLDLSHQQISEGFSPFVLNVEYRIYGPHYGPSDTFVYKGLIKTPSGPRLMGHEIQVLCKVLSADSFFNPHYIDSEF